MPTPTDSCPSTRHDAFIVARPDEVEAALGELVLKVHKEALEESLRCQSRLATFISNPERMTVIHVAIQVIDEEATRVTIDSLEAHNKDRFWQAISFAVQSFIKWKRVFLHRRG